MSKLENRPEHELKQIALDLFKDKIFTDRHIPENQQDQLLPRIFFPIGFGGFSDFSREDINDIGLIFEYLTEAGPRAINDFPMFFSLQILNKHDAEIVLNYYNEFKKITD